MARLDDLRVEAVDYVERHLEVRLLEDIADGIPARDLARKDQTRHLHRRRARPHKPSQGVF